MTCIRAVIFDFGGVLTKSCWDSRMISELALTGLKSAGLNLDDSFIEKFMDEMYEAFKAVLVTGIEKSMEDIIREFLQREGIHFTDYAIKYAVDKINEAPFCKFRHETPKILKELRDMGLKIGLISNTPSKFPRLLLEKKGLAKFFDAIVLSCEVGFRKPRKEIFDIVLERLGTSPEESVFVGDTLHIDIKGAKEAGMIAVLMEFGDPAMMKHNDLLDSVISDPPKPDFKVKSLGEIIDIIRHINSTC